MHFHILLSLSVSFFASCFFCHLPNAYSEAFTFHPIILYKRKIILRETIQEGTTYRETIQGEITHKRNYIEEELDRRGTILYKKEIIQEKDYAGKKYTRKIYTKETTLHEEGITQGKTTRRETILHKKRITRKKDYIKSDYIRKNCIEEKLYYIYIGKRLYGEETIQGRDYKGKILHGEEVQETRLYRKDYNIQRED